MILETAVLDVRAGRSDAFEAAFREAQSLLEAARGYRGHELRRGVGGGRYLLLVWWDDLESHLQGFRGSPGYARWKELLHGFYDPHPEVMHFEVPLARGRAPGRRPVIGLMGAGEGCRDADLEHAARLGAAVARRGFVLLTGGRPAGVMEAASRAAREAGGLVVGVLPSSAADARSASAQLDVAIVTGLGHARNAVNALSSDVVIACGAGGAGTASEVALALKSGRPVVLLAPEPEAEAFFRSLGGALAVAGSPEQALERAEAFLARRDASGPHRAC